MAKLDPQGDAREFFRAAYDFSKDHLLKRNLQYGHDYLLNRAFVDMTNRDDTIPHIAVPKIWSITETAAAREVKAHFGSAPYIESETQYDDMKGVVDLQNQVLHDFLQRGNFYFEAALACKIKILYGTAFMECVPYRKRRTFAVPHDNGLGGFNTEYKQVDQLYLRIRTRAPWECMFHQLSTDLESREGCGWAIKIDVTTRRLIRQQAMMEPDAYPGLDLDALGRGGLNTEYYNEHVGYQILQDFGLDAPRTDKDDDLCMLFRVETPDRYIWILNGNDVLRDIPNPYHDMVNLSRWVHIVDAHTQNRFYGIGEAKPNEINQNMMSDALSLLFQSWAYSTQPAMLFRMKNAAGEGVAMDDLLMSLGQRIPVVSDNSDRPLDDYAKPLVGAQVTKDQYAIIPILDNLGNMASKQYEPMRGEPTSGQHTLGEIGLAQQAGDVITEAAVRLGEEVFIDAFRQKAMAIIDGYATVEDLIPILGEEKAYQAYTMNPSRVPGGVNLVLKGSNRINNLAVKQQVLVALQPVLEKCYAAGMFEYAKMLLEKHEFTQDEIQTIIGEAQFNMEQQMAAQQEQMAAEMQLKREEMQMRVAGEQQNRAVQVQQGRESNDKDIEIAKIRAASTKQGGAGAKKTGRNMVQRKPGREAYAGALR